MKKILVTSLLLGSATTFASPFVVRHIDVEGIQPDAQESFISHLPIKPGITLNEQDISNLVRLLYSEGYDAPSVQQSGNALKISVQPQLTINKVTFSGNKSIPDAAIKDNLKNSGFAQGDILNRAKLNNFAQEMVKYFQSTGHYNATVTPEITRLPNNRANVKLIIDEGDKALLESITFHGNKAFSAGDLEDEMSLSPTAWWKLFGGKFEEAKFGKDLEALRQFYLNHGYAKMQITGTDVQFNKDKTQANVTIDINEGEQYSVTHAQIVGDLGGIAPSKFDDALEEIKLGETFRQTDVSAAEDKIKAVLGNQGYGKPQVQVSPQFDDAKKTMTLTFVVNAGKRYTVREIRFEGNTSTSDSTLRQEMRQQEGSWLSSQLVQLGKVRLDRTGFFETVDAQTVSVPGKDDQLDVVYKVKERNTGSVNFGIGYGTESGFSYNVSVQQDNFLGLGSSIALQGSHDDYGKNLSLTYNEPYFTKDGVSLGGSIFYNKYDNSSNDNVASYSKTSYGANGTLSFPVNENNAYYIGVGIIKNKLYDVAPEYHRWLYKESMNYGAWNFSSLDYPLSFGWNYNSLDRGFFPTSGVRASFGGRVMLPGSDNKYYSLNAEAQGYYPLDRDHLWVLHGKVSANYADGFGGRRLPFYQYYSAGGIGSLRGFAYGAVGPTAIYARGNRQNCTLTENNKGGYDFCMKSDDVVGGNAMGLATAELIMPTPFLSDKNQINVRTSVFVDAASVWDTHWKKDGKMYKDLPDFGDPSRIRASAGVAFQWFSPIGLLQFSYAKPIKKYANDDIEQFQFSVGSSF